MPFSIAFKCHLVAILGPNLPISAPTWPPNLPQIRSKVALWSHLNFNWPSCSITHYLQYERPLGPPWTGFEITEKSTPTATQVDIAYRHPQKCNFKSKMSRLGRNMAPTSAQHTSILVLFRGSKSSHNRPRSPTCLPRPPQPSKLTIWSSKTTSLRLQKPSQKPQKHHHPNCE